MSLQEIVEIKHREADLQKRSWPQLVALCFFTAGMMISLGVITGSFENKTQARGVYVWVMIAGACLYLAYCQLENRKRIKAVELELLKLRRELSFQKSP